MVILYIGCYVYTLLQKRNEKKKKKKHRKVSYVSPSHIIGPRFKPRQFGFRIHALLTILSGMQAP